MNLSIFKQHFCNGSVTELNSGQAGSRWGANEWGLQGGFRGYWVNPTLHNQPWLFLHIQHGYASDKQYVRLLRLSSSGGSVDWLGDMDYTDLILMVGQMLVFPEERSAS